MGRRHPHYTSLPTLKGDDSSEDTERPWPALGSTFKDGSFTLHASGSWWARRFQDVYKGASYRAPGGR